MIGCRASIQQKTIQPKYKLSTESATSKEEEQIFLLDDYDSLQKSEPSINKGTISPFFPMRCQNG